MLKEFLHYYGVFLAGRPMRPCCHYDRSRPVTVQHSYRSQPCKIIEDFVLFQLSGHWDFRLCSWGRTESISCFPRSESLISLSTEALDFALIFVAETFQTNQVIGTCSCSRAPYSCRHVSCVQHQCYVCLYCLLVTSRSADSTSSKSCVCSQGSCTCFPDPLTRASCCFSSTSWYFFSMWLQ